MNYYKQFIQPAVIIKDINFFYDQIKELIVNDIFVKYLRDNRKKIHKIYTIENYLSKYNKTRLLFNNDKIDIEFFVNSIDKVGYTSITNDGTFKNYKLENVNLSFKINLKASEHTNKIIYDDNQIFINIRKNISYLYKMYIDNFNKKESSKYKYIHKELLNLKKSHYEIWNNFIDYLIDITNPQFNNNLNKFRSILNGIKIKETSVIFNLIHNTEFYYKYNHLRQIKSYKFLTNLEKNCLDDKEIIYLCDNVAKCFNHKIDNYEECMEFLRNIINHFNYIYLTKERNIDDFVYKNWNIVYKKD